MSEHAKSNAGPRGSTATHPAAQRIQAKLAVSDRNDPMEREADSVAERVTAGQPAPAVSRMTAPEKKPETAVRQSAPEKKKEAVQRAAGPEKKEPVAQRAANDERKVPAPVQRAAGSEKKEPGVQRAAASDKKEPQGSVQRVASPEKKDLTVQRAAAAEKQVPPVQRQADERDQVQTRSTGDGSATSMGNAAQHAVDSKGAGRPLDSSVRSKIESSLGADMSHVRVHDDAAARASASALNARAFTHGSDIWMGPGESSSDLRLMGHEATHVVQQGGTVQGQVQRANGAGSGTAASVPAVSAEDAMVNLQTFRLPRVKARHRPVYEAWAAATTLKRIAGYDRGEPDQKDSVWLPGVTIDPGRLAELDLPASFTGQKTIEVHGEEITGSYTQLINRLKVPQWDRGGEWDEFPFEVDHIVELQVGSWSGGSSGAANELANMELLDKRSNARAGSLTRLSIKNNVRQFLESTGEAAGETAIRNYLRDNDVAFNRVVIDPEGSESDSRWWTRAEIESGAHLQAAHPVHNVGEAGSASSFALVSPGGSVLGEYAHDEGVTAVQVADPVDQGRVAGLQITAIQWPNAAGAVRDAEIGSVTARLQLPPQLEATTVPLTIPMHSAGQYAGYLGELPEMGEAHFPGLSLINFEHPTIEGENLVIAGRLTPSLPLLGTTPIDVVLRGREFAFFYYYSVGELSLPVPGISIDDVTLLVSYGTEGFRAEGSVFFSVDRLGSGSLTAGVDGSGNFDAGGSFDFDSELFDQARIEIWYRERAFGGRGTLRITQPDKVRGIRSLDASITFGESSVHANGTVVPDIPGVENATLAIDYSEEEGLSIRGTAALGRGIPGINSGSLEAEVRKPAGESAYQLFAHGSAVPAVPGINTTLDAVYDNGALTVSGHADYSRGMLSGGIDIGVTNREFDAAGQPTDAIGTELRVYGGGSVTIRIAPWLQGTVGVHILPVGEIELSGEIALPDQIEIFERKQINKSLLNIAVQVPIFPGVVAEIGGGLSAQAGIGPGVIDQLRIGITYNPAHEDQTHVTGNAHLNIPADAGLRLAVRAGIGLGITGASATGGLEIGGLLGIAGAAEAGVELDWLPTTGLRIDAYGDIHAEPIFRFDIGGYVSVRALGFEVYGNSWQFASYEFGSNLRFGVRFPIHYVEGQPFDVSLDDVEFTVPDIDPAQLLRGLVDRIA